MPVETAPFIDSLDTAWPEDADPVEQGAAHLRLTKAAIKSTFPNITAAVTATAAQINATDGRLGAGEARLTALEANRARKDIADTFAALMTFTTGLDAASVKKAGQELVPPGAGAIWFGNAAPGGWLLCNGAAVSRTTYAPLFVAIGTTFGAGDGSTTFNLPNVVDRYLIGAGVAARGATLGSQTPAIVVGSAGSHSHGGITGVSGAHSHGGATAGHAITEGQMPFHAHGVNDPGHAHGQTTLLYGSWNGANNDGGWAGGASTSLVAAGIAASGTGITIAGAGGNQAHAHGIFADGNHQHTIGADGAHVHTATIADGRPPSLAVNFIIKV